jgi:hypothetical protein
MEISARIFRHDTVTLHSQVREEEFERFMKDELAPFFSKHYNGPTRVSKADIKGQSIFKEEAKGPRKYLWITVWDGSPESVQGSSFEHTRMDSIGTEGTEAMLKKLESFGKRATEKVFRELEHHGDLR